MATKYTKWPQNIPNGRKMYQHLPLQDPPKIYPNWDFWFEKTHHLATLSQVWVARPPLTSSLTETVAEFCCRAQQPFSMKARSVFLMQLHRREVVAYEIFCA
jgi:hypothetical protein